MTITVSDGLAATMLTSVLTAVDAGGAAGQILIYTGTKPASPDIAPTSCTLLGTLTLSYPCGVVGTRALTFSKVTEDDSADASGTAAWARIQTSAGVAVIDVDASLTSGTAFLKMNTLSIVQTGPIRITSMMMTL